MAENPAPTAPAGWYDDARLLGIKRYWDGSAWTERTLPADDVPRAPRQRAPIAVAVVAVLVAISAVVFALTRPVVEVPVAAPSSVSTPTADPIPAGDYSGFTVPALGNLSDLDKDLDDFEKAVDEGGYWRLLSNAAELRINLEELRATKPPAFFAAEYDDLLDDLDDAIQDVGDAIQGSDKKKYAAIDSAREVADQLRAAITPLEG